MLNFYFYLGLFLSLLFTITFAATCSDGSSCSGTNVCCCQGFIIYTCICCDTTTTFCSSGSCVAISPSVTPSRSLSTSSTPTPTSSLSPMASWSSTPTFSLSESSSPTITQSQSRTQSSLTTRTLSASSNPSLSATRSLKSSPSVTSSPPPSLSPPPYINPSASTVGIRCPAQAYLQTVDCVLDHNNLTVAIVAPPGAPIDYPLPITNPVLVNGSLILSNTGQINLGFPYSYFCTQGNLTLNGTVEVTTKKKGEGLLACVNSDGSRLVVGDQFKLRVNFQRKKECYGAKINLVNITRNYTAFSNMTLSYRVKYERRDGCLENKYIYMIISLTITCFFSCVICGTLLLLIILSYLTYRYRKKYKTADNKVSFWRQLFIRHSSSSGTDDSLAELDCSHKNFGNSDNDKIKTIID